MRDVESSIPNSASEAIEVELGGTELLPSVRPLWESLFEHHVAGGAAGLAVQPQGDNWPLRIARYHRIFEQQPAFVLVARQGKLVVGYALAYADEPIEEISEGPVVTIESLVVLPEMRGQGLGGWLLEEAEAEAIEQWGAEVTALEVMTGNESALKFYERAGFVEQGETWLRPDPTTGGAPQGARDIDDDRLEVLLEEGSEILAIGLEEGPDDTWVTSDVLVGCQPEPGYAADGAALEAALAPFAAAGASSVFVALDRAADPAWGETLSSHGFKKALRLFTRLIAID
ncbi:GNAT superfamily N-acetyltransferase [Leucobacter exalbidus]|uniref:GNAT superfamily N-acetyltransferase n=1 Tax=Leucobacter exalbidus TaxID=662960 RepID=A0A940PP30_9MICO|nr:N-acetyltransferase [Leucobacter exalbidus]MBP1326590.1 GNAT superfamily N-acetyltransferase [Leucobacter exalbidus]